MHRNEAILITRTPPRKGGTPEQKTRVMYKPTGEWPQNTQIVPPNPGKWVKSSTGKQGKLATRKLPHCMKKLRKGTGCTELRFTPRTPTGWRGPN